MAETNGISAADRVLDEILTRGSKHLYEQYIVPKILPYTASTITQTFASLVNVSVPSHHCNFFFSLV